MGRDGRWRLSNKSPRRWGHYELGMGKDPDSNLITGLRIRLFSNFHKRTEARGDSIIQCEGGCEGAWEEGFFTDFFSCLSLGHIWCCSGVNLGAVLRNDS